MAVLGIDGCPGGWVGALVDGGEVHWHTGAFHELLALEAQLKARRAKLAAAEQKVAKDRTEAADSLARTRKLEAQARAAESAVAGQLAQQQSVERAAAQDVAKDRAQYAKLTAERATVEHRIEVELRGGLREQLPERGAGVPGALGCLLDQAVGLVAAHPRLDQRGQRPLAEQRSVGQLEVGAHPVGVHRHPLGQPH